MTTTYLLTELRRIFRNPRYLFFTIGIPVILFLVIGNAFEGNLFGVSAQTWYMVNMGVFGATGAVIGIGARIADERDRGWNRQLRLTPLPPLGYVMGKVLTGMLVALPALALVCMAGALTGEVHLSTLQWVQLIGLGWLAILPMAVVGVGLGYFSSGDNAQAVNGGTIMLMSMFGGIWFPITAASPLWMQLTAYAMPTYWITQITRAPLTHNWPVLGGWVVLGVWVAIGARLAARGYRRDDLRAA